VHATIASALVATGAAGGMTREGRYLW
jgi:hypothetical protein